MLNAACTIAAALLTASASGQCTPLFETSLGVPGINGGYIEPMVAWDDGTGTKLFVGGSATDIGGNSLADRIAAYDPATGQWLNLGAGLSPGNTGSYVTAIVPWDDGTGEKLYVAGQFAAAGGSTDANSFAAWDGTNWTSLGAGFTQIQARVIRDILPLDLDGTGEKLYLAGNFTNIGNLTGAEGIAIFDGTTYSVWGNGTGLTPGTSDFINDLHLWDDGSGPAIYACGRFTTIDGWPALNVARYNIAAGQWEAFGEVLIPDQPVYNNSTFAVFDDGTGPALYMGGQQFRINGTGPLLNIVKWDGSNWTPVGQQMSGRISELIVYDDGNGEALYAAGTGAFEIEQFARLEGNTWVPVNGGVVASPSTQPGSNSSVFGFYEWNGDLLIGGNFTAVGSAAQPSRGIAAYTACATPCPADLAAPFGDLTFADISAFLQAFNAGDPIADGAEPFGQLTFADITWYLTAFAAGCP